MRDEREDSGADPSSLELPATSRAVLGILSFGEELSGYDVKRWAEQSLAFYYWAPSQSQIYSELRRLETLGLAVSRVEQTHTAKSRRLYAITSDGRRRMAEWADGSGPEVVVLKQSMVLRLWAAHNGDVARLAKLWSDFAEQSRETAQRAAAHASGAEKVPAWRFPALALEWAQKYYEDEAARAEWVLGRLAELQNIAPDAAAAEERTV